MDQTIAYYDTNAKSYADSTLSVDFSHVQNRFLWQLRSSFRNMPVAEIRILDFGCGAGRDTKYFLEQGFAVAAIDGSAALCDIASDYTGIPVRQTRFEEYSDTEKYEGIWACASILHLPPDSLKKVLGKIHDALVPGGIFYTSFKYGTGEKERNGRHFTDMTEETFAEMLADIPPFRVVEEWTSTDVRPGREAEKWLNLILQKV